MEELNNLINLDRLKTFKQKMSNEIDNKIENINKTSYSPTEPTNQKEYDEWIIELN